MMSNLTNQKESHLCSFFKYGSLDALLGLFWSIEMPFCKTRGCKTNGISCCLHCFIIVITYLLKMAAHPATPYIDILYVMYIHTVCCKSVGRRTLGKYCIYLAKVGDLMPFSDRCPNCSRLTDRCWWLQVVQ